eukprot:847774_1
MKIRNLIQAILRPVMMKRMKMNILLVKTLQIRQIWTPKNASMFGRLSSKKSFGMEMPKDFFDFYAFSLEFSPNDPCGILEKSLGLRLVGPFEVLAGKFDGRRILSHHLHWRYHFDTPEFMTILNNAATGEHYGYFRDDPRELPQCIASNKGNSDCVIAPLADHLFGGVLTLLSERARPAALTLRKAMATYAKARGYATGSTDLLKKFKLRKKRVVCSTFNRIGLVVPYKDEYGYRDLGYSDTELKRMFRRMNNQKTSGKRVDGKDLETILTNINYANDEGDPGMGLQLGLDMFASFDMFAKEAKRLMQQGYKFIGRGIFADIVGLHIRNRTRENLSELT